jgi:uncharacterized membrane protein YoaK (UPF0700 family)
MVKRIVSIALWFLVGWTFGGLLTYATGASELIGPAIGLGVAALVWLYPRRLGRASSSKNRAIHA